MSRTASILATIALPVLVLLIALFMSAPAADPATASPLAEAPEVSATAVPGAPAPSDGGTDDAMRSGGQGTNGAVRSGGQGTNGADTVGTTGADDLAPQGTTDQGTADATPAEGETVAGDDADPDALPDDAPEVCVLLDMGAAACDAFVHPAPGEVSVAIVYDDTDEHAIAEVIAYDSEGPLDYVDIWEVDVPVSE